MKRTISLFCFCLLLFYNCEQPKDKIIAEVYHHKLFLSEALASLPENISGEDSTTRIQNYIENWIKEKMILYYAKQSLRYDEKQFDKEMMVFYNNLLTEAYYKKMTADSSLFKATGKELQQFIQQYSGNQPVSREVVKLNYVKLSKNSPIANKVKDILFNEEKRVQGKETLEKLCSDSIEYFIDNDTWLLLDYIESEFPFDIKERDQLLSRNKYIDVSDDKHRYLLVFLDFKVQHLPSESYEITAMAQKMIMQQKKVDFINQLKDSLYQDAVRNEKIILHK